MSLNEYNLMIRMLTDVAKALGQDLCQQFVFVGGCTTGLLLTDDTSREDVRHTDDVDLVVSVASQIEWYDLTERLGQLGFRQSIINDDNVVCRFRLGDLQVDFMPDNEEILGFTNRWYAQSLTNTVSFQLESNLKIKLLTSPYFIATKIEAFKGRGRNDMLGSRDIEDIFILLDGRNEVVEEIFESDEELKKYLSEEMLKIKSHDDYSYMLQGTFQNEQRENRLEKVINAIINKWPVYS